MDKTYYPIVPTSNRILQKKWDEKYYAEHRMLVRDARASIDTRPPKTYMHMHMKLKKAQLDEERAATIERDNRILLEKMSQIMRTTGSVDNRNAYETKSLNHEKRRKELLRVSKENATLAKRINEMKSENSRATWSSSTMRSDNNSKHETDGHSVKSQNRQKSQPKRSESVPSTDKKGVEAVVMKIDTQKR